MKLITRLRILVFLSGCRLPRNTYAYLHLTRALCSYYAQTHIGTRPALDSTLFRTIQGKRREEGSRYRDCLSDDTLPAPPLLKLTESGGDAGACLLMTTR